VAKRIKIALERNPQNIDWGQGSVCKYFKNKENFYKFAAVMAN